MREQRFVPPSEAHEVQIDAPGATLLGHLVLPASPIGVVAFAHGSGSSRFSPRNRAVAAHLHEWSIATLLLDLLTQEEAMRDRETRRYRFDIDLLAGRFGAAIEQVPALPGCAGLPIGAFGASTGAAAALIVAARAPEQVAAVVCRGGRPDLAGPYLTAVRAPTLLIVGELDCGVLELNQMALERIPASKQLALVPGATHLFEEPGALEAVAQLAGRWFAGALLAGEATGRAHADA